jgi:pyridoxamine 5'-phosphate oxidase
MRQEYTRASFDESDAHSDPIRQFQLWFNEALAAEVPEPNAMTLATATANGKPSARIVLLKSYDHRGFTFHTNYESRKGRELSDNPYAALVFFWGPLERQVRIEGHVERTSADDSDSYFQMRPLDARIGAWASRQSEVLPDRDALEARMRELEEHYADRDIPRPPHWGGFRVRPETFEFWQGRPGRLHDRIRYRKSADGGWLVDRLAP